MRSTIIGVLVGAVLGAAGGFAAGLFFFPLLFPPGQVGETVSGLETGTPRATGSFVQVDPSDRIHWGTGTVTVYDGLLHLGEDFEVGPGPKYHVYLVPLRGIDPATRVEETLFIDLGPLKAFTGSQDYLIPPGLSLPDYSAVVIWCEQLNALISPAELSFK